MCHYSRRLSDIWKKKIEKKNNPQNETNETVKTLLLIGCFLLGQMFGPNVAGLLQRMK